MAEVIGGLEGISGINILLEELDKDTDNIKTIT